MSSATQSFTSEAGRAAPAAPCYEKSASVLWAFTPEGIVLHNFAGPCFRELDEVGQLIWAYLDGVHSLGEVREELARRLPGRFGEGEAERTIARTVDELLAGGFIREAAWP